MNDTWIQQYQDYAGAEAVDSSGLEVKRLTFLETVAMIVGTNIGAGVLSMAYASCKTGFIPLLLWLAVAGLFTTISIFYVSETALRTHTHDQLSGFAQRYVGSFGTWAIFLSVAVNSIDALIAYMSDSGRILSTPFGISPALGSVLFFIPAAGMLYLELSAIDKGKKLISIDMVSMILILVATTLLNDNTEFARLLEGDWIYMVPVFNIVVFYFSVQYIVLEMARGFSYAPERLPKAVITGVPTTFVLLSIVPLSVIAPTGLENQSEVATLVWGKALGEWAFLTANTFALCAMLTSYQSLGGSFLTNIFDKFHKLGPENRPRTRLLVPATVALPPFVLAYSGLVGFVNASYFVGAFSGVILLIMPILTLRSARRNGDSGPAWKCGWIVHPATQSVIVTIYLASTAYAICSTMNLLPAGW